MRIDQVEALAKRQEELVDVFLEESKADSWPTTATKDGRGDRVWLKKNALATIQLAARIQDLLERAARRMGQGEEGDADSQVGDDDEEALRKEMAEAEQMARQILNDTSSKAKAATRKHGAKT